MEEDTKIFNGFESLFDVDGKGDKNNNANISMTVGVVVDTDDPLQTGRLRVFCPSLNDNPKKLQHLPWCSYVSPFGGVINNGCFTRGSDPDNCTTEGSVHYGFWAVPEQGAHVLVGCIDGDPRRRFWIGCFPSQQETHTLFTGRFKWNGFDGTPDGPFSSANEKIQPLYDNLSKAFSFNRTGREWMTRGADYQANAVNQDVGEIPNPKMKTYLDEQVEQISKAEPDQWVKDILGSHGYDWTGLKNLGAFLSSRVYGMTTPGFHALSMDDRPFNTRIKLRSTSGHMILMDDTNERIYIMSNEGNGYIEMDSSGNLDIYAKRRVSIHAENDINFSTDATFRVNAKKGIFMYAGDTPGVVGESPPDGQIRLHSSNDFHLYSDKNIREFAKENIYIEATQNIAVKSQNWFQETTIDFDVKAGQQFQILAEQRFVAVVAQSKFEVNSSSIISDTQSDVYFSTSAIKGSIIGINTTFTHKQDSGGSPMTPTPAPNITNPSINVDGADAEISLWTNRVPNHEPWPRVLKQGPDVPVNQPNDGYTKNAAWIDQFDNTTSPTGMEPIGKVEGNDTIERGIFWRR